MVGSHDANTRRGLRKFLKRERGEWRFGTGARFPSPVEGTRGLEEAMRLRMFLLRSLGKLLILAGMCGVAFPAWAQVAGSITGTVSDATGAVLPNAGVAVLAPETGIVRRTTTNSAGEYLATGLREGSYRVTVTAPGFKTSVAKGVVLRVGENIRRDVKLAVGEASVEVVVEGSAAGTIETQSSELSTTIDAAQISELVLNGRSFAQLVMLTPGVSDQTGQDEAGVGPTGSVSYAINGGRNEYNNWEIDGGDVMDSGSMANLNVFPSVDALEQVQVLTSSYDAEYGRSGSGTIEAVTKSGTNAFHGEAFEFVKNQAFNSRYYFNEPGEPIGAFHKNDFGYLVGGPIKRNKLFFFWSQEFRREEVPGFYQSLLPTNAERAGDFSAVCPASGEYSFSDYPDCPAYNTDSNTGLNIPFPNNNLSAFIDKSNANALLTVVPKPNLNPAGNADGYNFEMVAPAPMAMHEELVKIDDEITSKLHGSIRFIHDSWQQRYLESSPWSNSSLPGIPGQETGPGVSLVGNLNWTPSATLTNAFMFGYGANHLTLTNTTSAADTPAGLTMTALFNNNFGGKVPMFSVNGGQTYYGFTQDPGPLPFRNSNPTYTYRDTVTKLLKRHTIKTGFYFTANQKNEDAEVWTQGQLGFSTDQSSTYMTGNTTGNSFADMLVGDIRSFGQANAEPKYYLRFKIFEPFVQDDWHITQKLTLNLGLRMSMFGLYKERYLQAYNFDPAHFSAAKMPVVDQNTGALDFSGSESIDNLSGIVHCGSGGIPVGCMTGHLWNPAPRVGFAYDPFGRGKTAIRAAYGIFYEHTNGNEANAESTEGQPPLVLQPWQFGIHGYTKIGGGNYYPLYVQAIPTRVTWPYMQQYHLDIQQEILKNTLMTVSYVGSRGTHLTSQNDLNQLHDLNQAANPFRGEEALNGNICNNLTVDGTPNGTPVTGDALVHLNIACGNVDPDLYRESFPGWDTVQGIGLNASSSYNAFQVSGRRQAKDVELSLAYTWSHAIDNSSDRYDSNFVDTYNLRGNRASSNFDQRQIFNMTYIWHLPFLAHAGPRTRSLLGGWEWSGITLIQTGEPFSVNNGNYYGDNAGVANGSGSGSYVDLAPGVSKTHVSGAKFIGGVPGPILYNPSAIIAPRALTFGDSGRNAFNLPRRTQFDMGFFKQFALPRETAFQFRAEGFNVFNHPQFNGVNNSPGCYEPSGNQQYSAGASECVNGAADGSIAAQGFFHANSAHEPRLVQLGAKLIF